MWSMQKNKKNTNGEIKMQAKKTLTPIIKLGLEEYLAKKIRTERQAVREHLDQGAPDNDCEVLCCKSRIEAYQDILNTLKQ